MLLLYCGQEHALISQWEKYNKNRNMHQKARVLTSQIFHSTHTVLKLFYFGSIVAGFEPLIKVSLIFVV